MPTQELSARVPMPMPDDLHVTSEHTTVLTAPIDTLISSEPLLAKLTPINQVIVRSELIRINPQLAEQPTTPQENTSPS